MSKGILKLLQQKKHDSRPALIIITLILNACMLVVSHVFVVIIFKT